MPNNPFNERRTDSSFYSFVLQREVRHCEAMCAQEDQESVRCQTGEEVPHQYTWEEWSGTTAHGNICLESIHSPQDGPFV